MKSLYFIAFLAICCSNGSAQITIDHVYPGFFLYPACFSTGSKYVVFDQDSPTQLSIYNLDHSLLKLINIPVQPLPPTLVFLADDLFDTDSTNFEYMIYSDKLKVYRDDGALLFYNDTLAQTGTTGSIASFEWNNILIVNENGVFIQTTHNLNGFITLLKLPGKVHYCNSCCKTPGISFISPANEENNLQLGSPIPNPTKTSTSISYQLPEGYSKAIIVFYNLQGTEVKRFLVGSAFHDIQISTTDLVPGTYLYELQTADGKSDGKKMVVIK